MAAALRGELVLSAVNVDLGSSVPEEVAEYLPVGEQLGRVFQAREGPWTATDRLRATRRYALVPRGRVQQVLTEVMIAPVSRFVGQTLSDLDFQWHYNATVLAIHRRGQVLREKLRDTELNVGDILLMLTPLEEMRMLRGNQNFVVLSEKEDGNASRRKAWIAIAIMVSVVAVAFLELMPIVASAILGCIALVLTRVLEPDDVYAAIDWRVIVLLAGVLPLGIALQESGAASALVDLSMGLAGGTSSRPIAARRLRARSRGSWRGLAYACCRVAPRASMRLLIAVLWLPGALLWWWRPRACTTRTRRSTRSCSKRCCATAAAIFRCARLSKGRPRRVSSRATPAW